MSSRSSFKRSRKGHAEQILELDGFSVELGWDDPEVATIAAINADGSEDGRLPARPALANAVELLATHVKVHGLKASRAAARGRDPTPALNALAQAAEETLRQAIDDIGPPNADSTVRRKGFNDPLRGRPGPGRDRLWERAMARVVRLARARRRR